MLTTDPIADMLTRIRNSILARHATVDLPSSKLKVRIANVLVEEGYLDGVREDSIAGRPILQLKLKYGADRANVISGLKRISRPGCRVYVKYDRIPKIRGGLGTAIVSTSRGILTDRQARVQKAGGELICAIW